MAVKKQVLFVDDDELILSCYRRLIARHFSVETALGPAKALEALKESSFAVVATDLRMPGMSGIELMKRVKAEFPETVFLLLTGNGESCDAEVADHKDLIFKFLTKPCATADLVRAIEESVKQHRLNTEVKVR